MPSYQDTAVPFLDALWRLDTLLDTHPVLPDATGNGNAAACFTDPAFSHVHGFPSPIESDAGSYAMTGGVGEFTPTGLIDRRNTFHWQCWGFALDNNAPKTLMCRSGEVSSSNSNLIFINNGGTTVHGRLRIAGTTYNVSGTVVPGTWNYIVLQYNAGVVQLWINAVLVDQISGVTGNMEVGGDAEMLLGAMHSITFNVWTSAGLDEPGMGPAISEAGIIAIYEAAFNGTFLRGRSDANPTAILRSDFEPDPVSYPWRWNWSELPIERISFSSSISTAVTGVEESVAEREAPRREIEFLQTMRDDRERRRLRALLWANQHRRWFIPIRQYADQLTEPLSATATLTPISTAYKDYEIDSWIGFRQMNDAGEIVHWEERLITSLNPNSVEHAPLTNSYAAYLSWVYPVRRGLIRPQTSVKGHTNSVEEVVVTARLLPEDESITPNRVTPYAPTIKYRDVEVFDGRVWQSNDWSENREYEIERAGEDVDFDTGVFSFESDTAGASETFSYRMTIEGLDNISAFLGWYYERMGALRYVWVPSMQRDFDVLSINIPNWQITVRDSNYSDAYALAEPRRNLAFVYFDGSVSLRRVTAFELAGDNETLTLDASVPTTTNLRMISLLKYCRLDADQLELAWQTDNKVQVAWRFREPLHTPEGTGLSSLSPSASFSASISPSGSASPSASISLSLSPSLSPSPSASLSPSGSASPSASVSPSSSGSVSMSPSESPSLSPSASLSPSPSASPST